LGIGLLVSHSIAFSHRGTLVAERRRRPASQRRTDLSEPYSASFGQLGKPGPIHKYVMEF
jgi:hypothetical protein